MTEREFEAPEEVQRDDSAMPTEADSGAGTPSGHGRSQDDTVELVSLFGLNIRNTTLEQAADEIVEAAAKGLPRRVNFVNAHCVNVAASDAAYLRSLESTNLLYADGSGMALAARLAGIRLRDNVNGTDLFPILCRRAAAKGIPMALLGARSGRAALCAERMRERNPELRVVWTGDGYFGAAEEQSMIAGINASGAKILLVAMGVPRQELWLETVSAAIRPPVTMGVGALFDFWSGAVKRAPRCFRVVGMEWLFRLALEPRRLFGRYVLGNMTFLGRALRRRLQGKAVLTHKSLR